MNRTKIEYLDYTWNPYVGCSGKGCAVAEVCWAWFQARRRKHKCALCYDFIPHPHLERLQQPLKVKKPVRIGVCFMGDLFCRMEDRFVFTDLIAPVMRQTPQHTYVLLTKQPQNLPLTFDYPRNLWLGVSVNRRRDLWRIDSLKLVNPGLRFVSFEPLYEDLCPVNLDGIDWIIIGAQTRPFLRPKDDWIQYLRFAAADRGVPYFEKNNLALAPELRKCLVQQLPRQGGT
jgi:protein gp37